MQLFKNNASGTLASSIASGAASLSVGSGQGARFPTVTGSDTFTITVTSIDGLTQEIMVVTARSSDSMSVTRAQEGTSAAAFAAGAKVESLLTASPMTALMTFLTNAALAAIAALTPSSDKIAYFTSGTAAALTTLSSFMRTVLDDTDAATARTTLGAAAASHTHPASDIASGQVALARGGTNADLSATGGANQFVKQSSSGAAFTVGAIAVADLPSLSSSDLAGKLSDETGSGAAVFASGPTLSNPIVGTQSPGDNSTKAASTAYVEAAVAAGTIAAIDDIGDVDTTGVSDGDVLTYDSGDWIAAPVGTIGTASLPSWLSTHPDAPPSTPDVADDEFDTGSSIDTAGTRFTSATPWAWRNQGSATATIANDHLVIYAPAGAGDSFRIVEQAVAAGTAWRYRTKVSISTLITNYLHSGMVLVDSISAKLLILNLNYVNGFNITVDKYDSVTVGNSTYVTISPAPNGWVYFEIERSGSNLIFRYSLSGVNGSFYDMTTQGVTNFLTNAPDKIGIFANSRNSANVYASFPFFRREA